ncbi:hypothetical protein ACLOJK_025712 [Asimina triloba]
MNARKNTREIDASLESLSNIEEVAQTQQQIRAPIIDPANHEDKGDQMPMSSPALSLERSSQPLWTLSRIYNSNWLKREPRLPSNSDVHSSNGRLTLFGGLYSVFGYLSFLASPSTSTLSYTSLNSSNDHRHPWQKSTPIGYVVNYNIHIAFWSMLKDLKTRIFPATLDE